MVAAMVSLATPASGAAGFGDVERGRFFSAPIQWMADEGITGGTAPGCFSPHARASRAEVAVFFHRMTGEIDVGPEHFDDVPDGAFYARAVAWMAATGITAGTTPTTFDPHRPVTRAELATFLYRYHGEPPVDVDLGGICSLHPDAALQSAEAVSHSLLNQTRASLGRTTLPRTPELDAFARAWSCRMHDDDDLRHSAGGYAENIARWSARGASPEVAATTLHDLWVDSETGHYQNMIRHSHTQVGVGFCQGPNGWYATLVFSR